MKLQQKLSLNGGLNLDDDVHFIPEGDYRDAECIRTLSSEDNHTGAAENMRGTLPVLLPTGLEDTTFTCIGTYEDRSKQHLYYFACDTTINREDRYKRHTIFRYDGNSITPIVTSAMLNFSTNYPITECSIIENLLYWTDNNNQPRQINVDTIGTPSYDLPEFHLSLGKYPPMSPLYVATQKDPRFSTKQLKQLVQLTYRYVYKDGQKSTVAPYSLMQHGYEAKFYLMEYKRFGMVYGMSSLETTGNGGVNAIPLTDARVYDQIAYIEFFIRESQYLPFKLMQRIKVSDWLSDPGDTIISPDSTTLAVANETELAQLFDSVPIQSETLTIADNRVFLGNNLEEYPEVEGFKVEGVQAYYNGNWDEVRLADNDDLSVVNTPEGILKDPQVGQQLSFKAGGLYQLGMVFYDEMNRSSLVYTNDSMRVKFGHLAEPDAGVLVDQSSARAGYARQTGGRRGIPSEGIKIEYPDDNAPAYGLYDGSLNTYTGSGNFVCRTAGVYAFSGQLQIQIDNAFNRRVYLNLFRNGVSVANTSFLMPPTVNDIRTRQFSFSGISAAVNDTFFLRVSKESGGRDYRCELVEDKDNYMEMRLVNPLTTKVPVSRCAVGFRLPASFRPPEWAVSYQIVRTDCLNYESFLQGFTGKFQWYRTDPADINKRIAIGGYSNTDQDSASHMYIRIKQWYSSAYANVGRTKSNPPNEIFYNFQKGDKVAIYINDARYEYDIIEFAEDSLVIKRPFLSSELAIPEQSNLFIEVYREKKLSEQSSLLFYETGEWYPILYPKSESRAWSKSDWTYRGNSAVVRDIKATFVINHNYPFTFGDVHVIRKSFYVENVELPISNVDTQSMHPDTERIYERWEHADGRANTAYLDPASQKRKVSQIRFSERYVADSKINNTNRFYESNQNSLPANYGAIRATRIGQDDGLESAGQILVAVTENECVSVYINRRRLEDLSGSTSLVASDQVIGSYNALKGSYGTRHKESVVEYNGNVYYYCQNKGCVVRYGRDGLTPISMYKMRDFFQKRSQTYTGKVIGGFDPYHNQYIISFASATEKQTVVFNEAANRWEFFLPFTMEAMGTRGLDLVSYKNGQLFVHGKGNIGDFYGTVYASRLKLIANTEPSAVKILQNISLESSHAWAIPEITTPEGQQTRVILSKWKKKENLFYADVPRDLNTPNVQFPIVNGHAMRSTAAEILLEIAESEKSYLKFVNLYFIKSELSNPLYK